MNKQSTQKWLAFIGISVLSFSCYLDYTVVNVALPTIQRELNTDLASLQWVMNIYFLALCVLATIMGRCGDLFGRRKLFYIGSFIFVIASILAGFSTHILGLIGGRLLQGIGAAIVLPLGPSLIPSVFPTHEQHKAIGWLGSLGGLALALGPVIGGAIVTYLGWRWIFFINIPITIIGFLVCFKVLQESKSAEDQDLDWQGALILGIAMGSLVLGLIHTAWMLIVIALIMFYVLFRIEKNKAAPLIDFADFSKLTFFAGATLALLSGVLSAIALFFDPLYLQIIRGQSVQLSGLYLFTIPMAVLLIAIMIGWVVERIGIINTILLGLCFGGLAGLLSIFFTANFPLFLVIIAFILLGGLWAKGNTVSIIAAHATVGHARLSSATGTIVTFFNIGGSVGLAFGVMIYQSASLHHLQKLLATHSPMVDVELLKRLLESPSLLTKSSVDPLVHAIFNRAFMHGFSFTMFFLFALCTAAFLVILAWKIASNKKAVI